jgi:hypothetical protein
MKHLLLRRKFLYLHSNYHRRYGTNDSDPNPDPYKMSGIYTLKPRSSQKEITRLLYFLTSTSPAALVAQRPAALVAQRPAALVAQRPAALVAQRSAALVAQRPAALVAQRPAAQVELTNFLKQTKRERGQNEFKSFQLFPLLRWRAPLSRGLKIKIKNLKYFKFGS